MYNSFFCFVYNALLEPTARSRGIYNDCADELTLDSVFNAIFEKDSLASQPPFSRFLNCMDEDTLPQFDDINKRLRDIIYAIKRPEHMLQDLDSTLL